MHQRLGAARGLLRARDRNKRNLDACRPAWFASYLRGIKKTRQANTGSIFDPDIVRPYIVGSRRALLINRLTDQNGGEDSRIGVLMYVRRHAFMGEMRQHKPLQNIRGLRLRLPFSYGAWPLPTHSSTSTERVRVVFVYCINSSPNVLTAYLIVLYPTWHLALRYHTATTVQPLALFCTLSVLLERRKC